MCSCRTLCLSTFVFPFQYFFFVFLNLPFWEIIKLRVNFTSYKLQVANFTSYKLQVASQTFTYLWLLKIRQMISIARMLLHGKDNLRILIGFWVVWISNNAHGHNRVLFLWHMHWHGPHRTRVYINYPTRMVLTYCHFFRKKPLSVQSFWEYQTLALLNWRIDPVIADLPRHMSSACATHLWMTSHTWKIDNLQ